MEIWQKAIWNAYGFDVGYALERSPYRIKVLLCFSDQSSKFTLSEVSKESGVDYSNVKGIIIGEGGNYKKDRSFMNLGLLTCKKMPDGNNSYSLSDNGYGVVKILKKYHPINVDHNITCEVDKIEGGIP